jgi:hypothetical protein
LKFNMELADEDANRYKLPHDPYASPKCRVGDDQIDLFSGPGPAPFRGFFVHVGWCPGILPLDREPEFPQHIVRLAGCLAAVELFGSGQASGEMPGGEADDGLGRVAPAFVEKFVPRRSAVGVLYLGVEVGERLEDVLSVETSLDRLG